jgi:signal peptidase I
MVPVDFRVVLYRFVRLAIVLVGVGVIIKFTLLDTVLMRSDQMAPTLLSGDRVVLFRGHSTPVLNWVFRPKRNMPVILTFPGTDHRRACLRVAAMPGDSILIERGVFSIVGKEGNGSSRAAAKSFLPAEYSPRDFMAPFRIPRPGDTFILDSLSQRNFFFIAQMMKQEKPRKTYQIQADLYIDDSLSNDYIITAFPMYRGPFEGIPDDQRFDWFFWDRLREYLSQSLEKKNVYLGFSLLEDEVVVSEYTVGEAFAFLLADNWSDGYDSRYYGPIGLSCVEGRAIGVLWSFEWSETGKKALRSKRLMKIIL